MIYFCFTFSIFINWHSLQWNSKGCCLSRHKDGPVAACAKSDKSCIAKLPSRQNMGTAGSLPVHRYPSDVDRLYTCVLIRLSKVPCHLSAITSWSLSSDLLITSSFPSFSEFLNPKHAPWSTHSPLLLLPLSSNFFSPLLPDTIVPPSYFSFPFNYLSLSNCYFFLHVKLKRRSPRICLTFIFFLSFYLLSFSGLIPLGQHSQVFNACFPKRHHLIALSIFTEEIYYIL